MASYALLNAFSGFQFDMVSRTIGFNPIQSTNGHFRCFWSLDSAWGEFEMTSNACELRVLYGELKLQTLVLPTGGVKQITRVVHNKTGVDFNMVDNTLEFADTIQIEAGTTLQVQY